MQRRTEKTFYTFHFFLAGKCSSVGLALTHRQALGVKELVRKVNLSRRKVAELGIQCNPQLPEK